MRIEIRFSQKDNEIISFSAQELSRYMAQMFQDSLISINNKLSEKPDLLLQLTTELHDTSQPSPLTQPDLDDQYRISVSNGQGTISGSNARSVLFGVYEYLRQLGCRFLGPGADHERIPELSENQDLSCQCFRTASLRHRGVCIEGASSLENILDFIDWLPKLGYNCFFLQFQLPYTFMARWYHHEMNPLLKPEPFSRETAELFTQKIIQAMKQRGIMLHQAGHGWTGQAMGLDTCDWKPLGRPLNEEEAAKAAMINGHRQLFHGIPMNTNLCYSNPDAINSFTETVIQYVSAHPEIDYLHVWLADEPNNICECDACQNTTPSDQYVALLNHMDEALTRIGSPVKIAFLLYQELLWPPKTARIQNPDRFLLMFAPISRTFAHSYEPKDSYGQIPPYVRNHITLPTDLDENMAFLKGWQAVFSGDSFVYDYPLGRAHYGDFGYVHISRILHEDIRKIRQMGLNGYISCQELRAGLPNMLPNYVMGQTLFDESLSFDDIMTEYFSAAYGEHWKKVCRYLTQLSHLSNCDYFNGKGKRTDPQIVQNMERLLHQTERFRTFIKQQCPKQDPEAIFWKQLDYHSQYSLQLGKALLFLASGQTGHAQELWRTFQTMICQNELAFQSCLDVYRVSEVATKYTGFQLEEVLMKTL